ncbi:MAG: hypothetical protein WC326_04955 [Candidatus Delongbacteria bacterium]
MRLTLFVLLTMVAALSATPPIDLNVSATTDGDSIYVNLNWSEFPDASYYRIYHSSSTTEPALNVGQTPDTCISISSSTGWNWQNQPQILGFYNVTAEYDEIVGPIEPRNRLVPQEYATIQEAINAAAISDTIIVSNGIYYENLNIPDNKRISFVSIGGPDSTVIDGQNNEFVFNIIDVGSNENYNDSIFCSIDGFTIRNANWGFKGRFLFRANFNNCSFIDLSNLYMSSNYVDYYGCRLSNIHSTENDGGLVSFIQCAVNDCELVNARISIINTVVGSSNIRCDRLSLNDSDIQSTGIIQVYGDLTVDNSEIVISDFLFGGGFSSIKRSKLTIFGRTGSVSFWEPYVAEFDSSVIKNLDIVSYGTCENVFIDNCAFSNEFGTGIISLSSRYVGCVPIYKSTFSGINAACGKIYNSIICNTTISPALLLYGHIPDGEYFCNGGRGNCIVFYNNTVNYELECLSSISNTFELDPRFCDQNSNDFRLSQLSPCLVANNENLIGCGNIGYSVDLCSETAQNK